MTKYYGTTFMQEAYSLLKLKKSSPLIKVCKLRNTMKSFRIPIWIAAVLLLLPLAPVRADTDEAPDVDPQVMAIFQKGWVAYQEKRLLEVPALLDQALAKAREVKDVAGEAIALFGQSEMYRRIGFTAQAKQLETQAEQVLERNGDKASTLRKLAGAYRFIGQSEKSLGFYNRSLALSREAADKSGEAETLLRMSQLYFALGQNEKGSDFAQQALLAYRTAKNPSGEAETLALLGAKSLSASELSKALEYFQQALSIAQAQNNLRQQSFIGSKMASLYLRMGKYQEGMERFQKAIDDLQAAVKTQPTTNLVFQTIDKRREASLLSSLSALLLSEVFEAPNAKERSLEALMRAKMLYQEAGEGLGAGAIASRLSTYYQANNQLELAQQNALEGLAIFREFGHKSMEASSYQQLAGLSVSLKGPEQGLEYYRQALALFREMGMSGSQASALHNIAILEAALNRPDEALRDGEEGLLLSEKIRDSLGGLSDFKVSYLETLLPRYHHHISLLLQNAQPEKAFEWSEKTKARVLVDLMQNGKVDLSKGLEASEREKESALRKRAATLNAQIVAEMAQAEVQQARLLALQKELTAAENQLQTFTTTLYAKYPQLARKRAAKTATLSDVAELLPADTALLSYLTMSDGRTLLFAVTNEGGKAAVRAHTVAAKADELGELLEDFRASCANPKKNYKSKARELNDLLIAPAAAQLAGKTRLLICPDGMLWGLPFQALLNKNDKGAEQFLIERYEVNYAYSASGAQAALSLKTDAGRRQAGSTLLVLANPDFGGPQRFAQFIEAGSTSDAKRPIGADSRAISAESRAISAESRAISAESRAISAESRELPITADGRTLPLTRGGAIAPLPGTQLEADALHTDFPDATIYTGDKALEANAKKAAPNYRYVHFATHGLFNDAAPMLSSVVLAQPAANSGEDGFLTAREIFDLDLNADLVTLSACNTGSGQKKSGEGVIGLTWALFVAGAPTQVVSQWAVNDQSTATLMKKFYAQLKSGQFKGAALRNAELEMMRDSTYAHPFYWAPFILMGDWGS
jgi:CHAT domain-containing protein